MISIKNCEYSFEYGSDNYKMVTEYIIRIV